MSLTQTETDNRFSVVPGGIVSQLIEQHYGAVYQIIVDAYQAHHQGQTINPDSQFLRYPDKPQNRIISLPAHIHGDINTSGMKWIASFPGNIEHSLPRASAVLLLNNGDTGYPFACLEAAQISATRTAASAVAGAYYLNKQQKKTAKIGIIGNGIIARNIFDGFHRMDWAVDQYCLFDQSVDYANSFADYIETQRGSKAQICDSLEQLIRSCDVIVTATTAGEPYINEMDWFKHNPIVLNISLRDFSPELVLQCNNVMDDVEHCLKANTSPHLAYQQVGNRDFINGDIGGLLSGDITLDDNKPSIFSPFGLGVLDIALGHFIYQQAREQHLDVAIDNFFAELSRW